MEDILWKHREEYIRGFDNVDEGIRSFDCLVALVEWKTIQTVEELVEHGCELEWFEDLK